MKQVKILAAAMLAAGLVDEVRALMADPQRHPTAIQAIGYKEIAAALRGEVSMEQAIRWTKQATRNLAKRQLTWFGRNKDVRWLYRDELNDEELLKSVIDECAAFMKGGDE